MDQNEYPRPDANVIGGVYAKDKNWGIAIVVFSILGILCGGLATLGGGAMTAFGAAGAATATGRQSGAGSVAASGGLVMMIGIATALLSIVRLVGGLGVMKGTRMGFLITAGVSALLILFNLGSLPSGIISIVISGIILYYCYSRLSGKEGPTPV